MRAAFSSPFGRCWSQLCLGLLLGGSGPALPAALPAPASAPAAPRVTVFADDFSALKVEMLSAGVIGAEAEYHYYPATAPRGAWEVSCFNFLSDSSQRAWHVLREDGFGRKYIYQRSTPSERETKFTHPLLVAGDPLWRDYQLRVRFVPERAEQWSGVVFRYRNDRCLYFFGVKGEAVYLALLHHGTGYQQSLVRVLAQQPYAWRPGTPLTAEVDVRGPRLQATLVGGPTLTAEEPTFAAGRIGLLADVPTRYLEVQVTMTAADHAAWVQAAAERARTEEQLEAANPRMVVWKKLALTGFGSGRSVRFGDLDGDGQTDVLVAQVLNHGPKDRFSEVGCLTALTFDVRRLWQTGLPDPWRERLTSDVAVQVHDLDGDGRCEVVYCRGQELLVAEGATGRIKARRPTPAAPPPPTAKADDPQARFPRILGDSLYFLDLRGQGRPGDLLLKDRYQRVWAYTGDLQPLWQSECRTGHYPYAADLDGDGRDEVAIGYSLFDHDGRRLWSLDDQVKDHADGVALVRLHPDDPAPRFFCAASDEGVFWADLQGRILRHLQLGHVQNPTIANLRDDLPGLETVSVNFWANQGIVHFFDARMNVYHDCEPMQHGSMMSPLNWTGRSEEYFVLSAALAEGVYDGWGRRVLRFPADGHPEMCCAVLDLTGDCRDEIVVWDAHEMWVYTQADNPKPGRLYRPVRNPQYNQSNYQANVSLPGWNDAAVAPRRAPPAKTAR